MKTLIIAEKPSVAGDLARVLGKIPKKGDFYENDEYVISSAVGHLVELYMPEDISKDLKRWTIKTLPIVPDKFKLKPIDKTKQKFQELKKLIAREDVGAVINACDAGREGELIFTYILELAKNKKPVKRLWMSSMTPDAIRSAFSNLREDKEMQPLQDAARSRSEADWLIGINGTRGATVVFGRRGGRAATVGRVQTPTLSLVYQREMEIRNFKPRDYWRIFANFGVAAGEYEGVYQKPDFKKSDDEHDRADRLWNKEDAEAVVQAVLAAGEASVTEEKKRTKQSSPRLYDLTSLQREANSRFGLSAGHTLNIAQALYEKHKMITYPRTDSRALPEDYGPTVKSTLANLDEPYAIHAEKVLNNNWVHTGNKRIFNNKQVSDHFAIIPTDAKPKKLGDLEAKIFDMIARRTIAIFFPPAEFDVTTRTSVIAGHSFKTEGKVLAVGGWMDVYGKGGAGEDTLTPLTDPDFARSDAPKTAIADRKDARLEEDQTKPPPRYSEATLLSAMEGAGKLLDDEELAEAMKEKGLGTPATRAATIDHLAHERYIERQGRELLPTQKAESLMQFLKQFDIEQLTSPAMTGEWEHKLRLVEEGELSRDDFMKGIVDATQDMVNKLNSPPPPEKTNLVSPTNNQPLLEDHRAWFSQDKVEIRGREYPLLQVNKVIGNRKLDLKEVEELITKKEIGPLDGFTSRNGKTFSAILKLIDKENGTKRVELDFGNNGEEALDESVDLSQYPVVGNSPVDGTPVRETPNAYVSEGRDPDGKPAFRLSRNMLSKALPAEEVKKLLAEKKTGLIKGFKSNRTGRLFDAHLLLKEDGKIGFEFPPRPPRKKAAKKAAKKATNKDK
ncbi:DNA topoisomerase III [Cerasicoccus fimbriatus]|uniref:DNA topoisomerase III n=1 Tax=Cerasicoccus fimbriatus TaxID=3014554 RepID=UPI0022B2F4D1|nr:DNA topoisomerase III [Cerasicoccus sp. TK19100]